MTPENPDTPKGPPTGGLRQSPLRWPLALLVGAVTGAFGSVYSVGILTVVQPVVDFFNGLF